MEVEEEQVNLPDPEPIAMKEMNNAIKSLKRNKAPGPDGIPNEAMIEANHTTREMYLEVINEILKKRIPPEEWQKGHIKRLYKGKGKKRNVLQRKGHNASQQHGEDVRAHHKQQGNRKNRHDTGTSRRPKRKVHH